MQTGDLLQSLTFPNVNLEQFLTKAKPEFLSDTPAVFWSKLIQHAGCTKAAVIADSDFEPVYFYEIIRGTKKPSRDKVIRLLLGMHLGVDDCQTALKHLGLAMLYPRIRRDSILLYAVNQKCSVRSANELLIQQGEMPLK